MRLRGEGAGQRVRVRGEGRRVEKDGGFCRECVRKGRTGGESTVENNTDGMENRFLTIE